MFPTNLRYNHWGATFVFNDGDIMAASDDASLVCAGLVFCYCSLHPCGTTRIPNKLGIIWILNTAFSYQEEQNANANHVSIPNQIKWHSPFRQNSFGDNKGTKTFSALRVLDNGVHYPQGDAHSCGISLVAAILIILRVIIGTNNDGGTCYNKMFRCDCMEIKVSTAMKVEEDICYFPSGLFPIPSKEGKSEQKEEIIAVLKDWIKDADYAEGVIPHVINIGNKRKFVSVPPGESILIHTKKVRKLRYIHPHTMGTLSSPQGVKEHQHSPGKRMKQIPNLTRSSKAAFLDAERHSKTNFVNFSMTFFLIATHEN